MGQSHAGGLFSQRKEGSLSKADILNEADFHRCHLSERMGEKAVECCGDENDGDEEVEPCMHFMHKRRNG